MPPKKAEKGASGSKGGGKKDAGKKGGPKSDSSGDKGNSSLCKELIFRFMAPTTNTNSVTSKISRVSSNNSSETIICYFLGNLLFFLFSC